MEAAQAAVGQAMKYGGFRGGNSDLMMEGKPIELLNGAATTTKPPRTTTTSSTSQGNAVGQTSHILVLYCGGTIGMRAKSGGNIL